MVRVLFFFLKKKIFFVLDVFEGLLVSSNVYNSVNLTYIFFSSWTLFFSQRHPHVLNLNELKVSTRPRRLRCCRICRSSSSMAEEEEKELEEQLLTLRGWDDFTKGTSK